MDKAKKKLSENLINEIRDYYNEGNSCRKTAAKFGVSKTTVIKYVETREIVAVSEDEKKKRAVIAVQKRRKKIKELAIEYKGGCCEKCGYNKYNEVLEFHHLDPTKKDFGIASDGHCKSWEKVKKELDKCIMVCANCHREIHVELKIGQ